MGRFFSFDKKTPVEIPAEDNPALGAENAGHPILEEARASTRAALESTTRRRGRPRGDAKPLQSDSSALPREVQEEIQRQIEGALDPRAWSALLALPADTMLAISGREHWKISKDERETLGATGSAMARAMMIANPKMLCAIMLSSALFSVYVPRGVEELKYQRSKIKKIAEEKKDAAKNV